MTFWSPSWRSLSLLKGHLTIPKRSQRIARCRSFFVSERSRAANKIEENNMATLEDFLKFAVFFFRHAFMHLAVTSLWGYRFGSLPSRFTCPESILHQQGSKCNASCMNLSAYLSYWVHLILHSTAIASSPETVLCRGICATFVSDFRKQNKETHQVYSDYMDSINLAEHNHDWVQNFSETN